MSKSVWLFVKDILIAFVVILIVLQFVRPTIVFGSSMENTLSPHDYVFLAKQAYHAGEVQRGDIIVFKTNLPDENDGMKNLIKRVIGLPGDTLAIHNGTVYLNGEALDETYLKDGATDTEMTDTRIPENSYFAMGDNRQDSMDSRHPAVGFVSEDAIRGKVVFRLFPISVAGTVD